MEYEDYDGHAIYNEGDDLHQVHRHGGVDTWESHGIEDEREFHYNSVVHETAKAIRFSVEGGDTWVPKSVLIYKNSRLYLPKTFILKLLLQDSNVSYMKDLLPSLDEESYYSIEISLDVSVPPFPAILFTGYGSAALYSSILVNSNVGMIFPTHHPLALVKLISKVRFPTISNVQWDHIDWKSPRGGSHES